MEIILLILVILETCFIVYLKLPKQLKLETLDEKELRRREKEEESWNKLFNYNETIATRGYKE